MRCFSARPTMLVAGVVAVLFAGAALAGKDHDHDRARRALEAGEVLPLRSIIERVEREQPGQLIEVELERDEGRWLYELKLLRDDGSMARLIVDARDGRVLSIRGRHTAIGEERRE